jgi:hypothetical protein
MGQTDPQSTTPTSEDHRRSAKQPSVYRDGNYLVVPQRWVALPAGCVVCGAPECGRMRLKIRKASTLYALFGLFGAVAYNSSPTARLRAGVCTTHRNEERVSRLPTQLMIGGSIACVLASVVFRTALAFAVALTGPLVLLQFAAMYAIVRPKLLTAKHADRGYIWLSGVAYAVLTQAQEVATASDTAGAKSLS